MSLRDWAPPTTNPCFHKTAFQAWPRSCPWCRNAWRAPKNVRGGGYGRSEGKGFCIWGAAMQKVPWSCLTDPYLALISLQGEASSFPLYSSCGRKSVKESLFLSSADYQVKETFASKEALAAPSCGTLNKLTPSSGGYSTSAAYYESAPTWICSEPYKLLKFT